MKLDPKWALLCLLIAASIVLTGCRGVGETEAERKLSLKRDFTVEQHMAIDDLDAVLMTDQPSRLSRYSVR